jgi:hypothetical protein
VSCQDRDNGEILSLAAATRTLALLPSYQGMQYICDAPGQTSWFRIETEGEAARESDAMHHAVEKHSSQAHEAAVQTYRSSSSIFIEQDIGLAAHVQRVIRIIIVGLENRDP